jgi:hypothetical protein
MASLTGQTIQSTYDSLLKISGNDPLTASLQRITDGLGNFTPLYLSTTAVEISSGLNVVGSITGSNLSGTNTGDETNSSIKTKLGASSGSQDGYLTSTDWSTFNAKQPALGYTPVPQTRTLTINGTTFDLSADRSWTIAAGVTSFNTRTGAITLTSGDVTGALGYTPVTDARTLTINGTTFDLTANRSFSVGTVTGSGTAARIPYFATSTSLANSQIFIATDESIGQMIGIGATPNDAPTPHRLFVSGTSYFTNALRVNAGITATSYVISGGNNNQLVAAGGGVVTAGTNITISGGTISANNTSQWTTSGSNIFYNTGNVGIGATSPATNLHIASTVNSPQVRISSTGSGVRAQLNTVNDHGDWLWGVAGDTTGDGLIYTAQSKNLRLFTADTERMRITSGGNVGIGTTSPADRLHVSGNIRTQEGYLQVRSSSDASVYINNEATQWRIRNNASNNFIINDAISDKLTIVYNTGNVGIGTTSPVGRLSVVGDGIRYMPVSDASGNSVLVLKDDGSNGTLDICSEIIGDANAVSNPITFRVSNVSAGRFEAMRITSGGNVGIGTTSPACLIHGSIPSVSNNIAEILRLTDGTLADFKILLNRSTSLSNSISVVNTAAGNMSFETGNTERMRITSAGNVGIGTTSPGARLAVAGNGTGAGLIGDAGFGGNYTGISLNGTLSTTSYNILSSPTDVSLFINRPTGANINFRMANSDQMIITSAGAVGIGTSGPLYTLHVVGNIYATTDVLAFSDISVKTNIRPIENALEKVLNSRGVIYDRIDTEDKDNIGFIAQELEVNFPELVSENADGTKAVKYQNAVAVLFEAIKELQAQINELKK